MADQDNYKTYVRETRTTESSGGGMALIVGGLIVAVGFILWLVFGGDAPVVSTSPEADTTNVTIDADEPAAEPAAPVEPAPADPVETAPAAPADDAEPATNP